MQPLLIKWLSKKSNLDQREVSYWLSGAIVKRYVPCDFKEEILCHGREFDTIQLGGIYKHPLGITGGKEPNKLDNPVIKRELVFDIDLTDYPRNCCGKEYKVCSSCWIYIRAAMEIIYLMFTQVYGCKEEDILWLYTGGRGIHIWILDERYDEWDDDARYKRAIHLIDKNEYYRDLFADKIFDKYFHDYLEKQEWLKDMESIKKFSEVIRQLKPDYIHGLEGTIYILERKMRYNKISEEDKIKILMDAVIAKKLCTTLLWPRIDIPVTKLKGHLLRCPFTMHYKTGKYCIPIEFEKRDTFDPVTSANSITQDDLKLFERYI